MEVRTNEDSSCGSPQPLVIDEDEFPMETEQEDGRDELRRTKHRAKRQKKKKRTQARAMTKSSKIKASPATLLLMLLRLGTLNVRGFKDENKQRDVIHFARMHNVDILLLQETNLSRAAEVYELKRKFSVDCFFSLTTRQFCGAGILILKKDLLHKHFFHQDYCGSILTLDLTVKGTNIRTANIYAPVKESEQNQFFETLNAYLTHSMPIIQGGGDFNNVLNFD
ncbi:hypothetical protein HPB48_026141 [Haemaphysalis longicornis]|uniref:Endonuclease/exonuclease/phosphatase domain-containing protein n=1 Tax=Haemaphysalis longicornis TaxID=44386 RepID=A0A9J6HA25_HAELO|nr:hypothetical protein HPB48_026141 [Haemaphysalis longicornis]